MIIDYHYWLKLLADSDNSFTAIFQTDSDSQDYHYLLPTIGSKISSERDFEADSEDVFCNNVDSNVIELLYLDRLGSHRSLISVRIAPACDMHAHVERANMLMVLCQLQLSYNSRVCTYLFTFLLSLLCFVRTGSGNKSTIDWSGYEIPDTILVNYLIFCSFCRHLQLNNITSSS